MALRGMLSGGCWLVPWSPAQYFALRDLGQDMNQVGKCKLNNKMSWGQRWSLLPRWLCVLISCIVCGMPDWFLGWWCGGCCLVNGDWVELAPIHSGSKEWEVNSETYKILRGIDKRVKIFNCHISTDKGTMKVLFTAPLQACIHSTHRWYMIN